MTIIAIKDRVSFRPYHRRDRETCLAILDSNVPYFIDQTERADFEKFLDKMPCPYFVLEKTGGDIIACGGYLINPEKAVATLCWGLVDSQYHGKGYGRLLFNERINRIKANSNVNEIQLDTSQHVVGFFQRLGFVVLDTVKNGYGPGLHRCDMRLSLAGYRVTREC